MKDFMNDEFLVPEDAHYFDSACQTLRPASVLAAMRDYYENFNSCGERVKYKWGQKVDEKVDGTREKLLEFLELSPKKYFVSFTQNTTYGLNLILSQLNVARAGISRILTSDIEHNSPFLATMALAKRTGLPREIITREDDGSLPVNYDYSAAILVVNVASNIDGRKLKNLHEIVRVVHKAGGLVILDCAQATVTAHELLRKCEADAMCFSAHKAYSASLGAIVMRRDFIRFLDTSFIGGGMVDDASRDGYVLSASSPKSEHIHTIFEAGLQPYAEIIAFGEALDFILRSEKNGKIAQMKEFGVSVFEFLGGLDNVVLLNSEPATVLAFYMKNLDGHLLAEALNRENIMVRSGYFCCHYYLSHVLGLPPLVRVSLGLHNSAADVEHFKKVMAKVSGK
ncbi:MAG: aminotransferase class V-fold PLP-dependent enzyme [Candidatus Nomurabacteria bacterium]|jgi:cysteine desulfurase/selenocysteine lyase|nr:aminotransferase class V-fold PLP-dependent enzyme [Candidatus Nomurabacteria bacterium]